MISLIYLTIFAAKAQLIAQEIGEMPGQAIKAVTIAGPIEHFNNPMMIVVLLSINEMSTLTLEFESQNQICSGHNRILCHVPGQYTGKLTVLLKCVTTCKYSIRMIAYSLIPLKLETQQHLTFHTSSQIAIYQLKMDQQQINSTIQLSVEYLSFKSNNNTVLRDVIIAGTYNLSDLRHQTPPFSTINERTEMIQLLSSQLGSQNYYLIVFGSHLELSIRVSTYITSASKELQRKVEKPEIHQLILEKQQAVAFKIEMECELMACLQLWKGMVRLELNTQKMHFFENTPHTCIFINSTNNYNTLKVFNELENICAISIHFTQIQGKTLQINHNRLYESVGDFTSFKYTLVNYRKMSASQEDTFVLRVRGLEQDNISLTICYNEKCEYMVGIPTATLHQYKEFRLKYPTKQQSTVVYQFQIIQKNTFSFQLIRAGYLIPINQTGQRFYLLQHQAMLFSYTNSNITECLFEVLTLTGNLMLHASNHYNELIEKQAYLMASQVRVENFITGKFYLKVQAGSEGSSFIVRVGNLEISKSSEQHFILNENTTIKEITLSPLSSSYLIVDTISGYAQFSIANKDQEFISFHGTYILKPEKYVLRIEKKKRQVVEFVVMVTGGDLSCRKGVVGKKMTLHMDVEFISCITFVLQPEQEYEIVAGYSSYQSSPLFFGVFADKYLLVESKSYLLFTPKNFIQCKDKILCRVMITVNDFASASAKFLVQPTIQNINLFEGMLIQIFINDRRTFYLDCQDYPIHVFTKVLNSDHDEPFVDVFSGIKNLRSLNNGEQFQQAVSNHYLSIQCKSCQIQIQASCSILSIPSYRIIITPHEHTLFQFTKLSGDDKTYHLVISSDHPVTCTVKIDNGAQYEMGSSLNAIVSGVYLISCTADDIASYMTIQALVHGSVDYQWMKAQETLLYFQKKEGEELLALYRVTSTDPITVFHFTGNSQPTDTDIKAFLVEDGTLAAQNISANIKRYKTLQFHQDQITFANKDLKPGMTICFLIKPHNGQSGNLLLHNEKHALPLPHITINRTAISSQPHLYTVNTYMNSMIAIQVINHRLQVHIECRELDIEKEYHLESGKHWLDLAVLGQSDVEVLVSLIVKTTQPTHYSISQFMDTILSNNTYLVSLSNRQKHCFKFLQTGSTHLSISSPDHNLFITIFQQKKRKESVIKTETHLESMGLYSFVTEDRAGMMTCCMEEKEGRAVDVTVVRKNQLVNTLTPGYSTLFPIKQHQKVYFQASKLQYQYNVIISINFCSSYQPKIFFSSNLQDLTSPQSHSKPKSPTYDGTNFLIEKVFENTFFRIQSDQQIYVLIHSQLVQPEIGNPFDNVVVGGFYVEKKGEWIEVYVDDIKVRKGILQKAYLKIVFLEREEGMWAEQRCQLGYILYKHRWEISLQQNGIFSKSQTYRIQIPPNLQLKNSNAVLNLQFYYNNSTKFYKHIEQFTDLGREGDANSKWVWVGRGVILFLTISVVYSCYKRCKQQANRRESMQQLEMVQ